MIEKKLKRGTIENDKKIVFLAAGRNTSLTTEDRHKLAEIIRRVSYKEGGPFPLSSGKVSSFYFDMKKTMLNPEGLKLIALWMSEKIIESKATAIGGIELGAIPVVSPTMLELFNQGIKINSFIVRKKPKEHGTKNKIEGHLDSSDRVIIVDDVITTGRSILEAICAVEDRGAEVLKVLCLVDREDEKSSQLEKYSIEPLFTATDFKSIPKEGEEKSDGRKNSETETNSRKRAIR